MGFSNNRSFSDGSNTLLFPRGTGVLVLAGMACVLVLSPFPALGDQGTSLVVVSSSSYVDGIGYMRVVGEVKNTRTVTQDYVGVEATFYDSQGGVVGTAYGNAFLEVLAPGQSSPFDLFYLEISKVAQIDSYQLATSSTDSSKVLPDVSIPSSVMYIPAPGFLFLFGEVKNDEDVCLETVGVVATFYDASGVVCAAGSTYTPVHLVEPRGVTPFEIDIVDPTRTDLIESYSLEAQSTPAVQCPYTGQGGLIIASSSTYVDDRGYSTIVGEVENGGNKTAEYVHVAATAYDPQGNVVSMGRPTTDPATIEPGASLPFEIKFYDKENVPVIHRYSLDIGTTTTIATIPQYLWPASITITILTILYTKKKGRETPGSRNSSKNGGRLFLNDNIGEEALG